MSLVKLKKLLFESKQIFSNKKIVTKLFKKQKLNI